MPGPNVFALQLEIAWEDRATNHRRVRELVRGAALPQGALLVLPEMFASGFSMNLAVTRQSEKLEDEHLLAELAQAHGIYVAGGTVSGGANGKGRNEAVVYSPEGALLARYAKVHPFTLGGESEMHERGRELAFFEWQGLKAAPFVCYDLRFPELFRAASKAGAELFIVMALWPAKRQQHWLTLLQARAIENQAYVVGVNRVGAEPNHVYAGRSVVVDPHGVIIADAGEREQVLAATIEPSVVHAWRRDFRALRDAHWEAAR